MKEDKQNILDLLLPALKRRLTKGGKRREE